MREVQGGIIASSFFVIFFALSGLLRAVLHYISPITGKHVLLFSRCSGCTVCGAISRMPMYVCKP